MEILPSLDAHAHIDLHPHSHQQFDHLTCLHEKIDRVDGLIKAAGPKSENRE